MKVNGSGVQRLRALWTPRRGMIPWIPVVGGRLKEKLNDAKKYFDINNQGFERGLAPSRERVQGEGGALSAAAGGAT